MLRFIQLYLLLTLQSSRCSNLRLGPRYFTRCIPVECTNGC